MKRKIYKLLSSAKQGLFAIALTVFSGTAYSQTTYTLNYTGGVQTLTVSAGIYGIKMWGADGGNSNNTRAGIGGYSQGTLTLASTTTLYIVVGGTPIYTGVSGSQPGGYNGGGDGYANATGRAGGGATHIATLTGVLSALVSNTSAVLIVAGGGGGDQNSGLIGHGGGLSGGGTYPGTQTGSSGGIFGSFGEGGDITISYGGGGGGGWYGGGGDQNNAGSGGSGYIGGVTSGTTIMTGQTGFVTKPIVTGDGLVLIEELCNISLSSLTGSGGINAICSGGSATLITNAISNYSWSTGATTSSIVISPTVTTLYSLTATSPSNCTTSSALTITVDPGVPTLTVVNTANSGGICPSKTVALTASGATTYSWTGGTITVTNGIVFAPTVTSDYTVTGSNSCGTSSAVTSVSIHPIPTVTAVASTASLCSGLTLTLTGVGNSTAYAWSGGTIPITDGVGFSPVLTNTYTVIGTSALSCTASATIPVTVVTTPVTPPIASPALICIGKSSTISAQGATNYTIASATQTVFTNTLVATPTSSGTTSYTITKSNANCFNTQVISVVTNSLPPVIAIVTPTLVCALNPATLAVAGGISYTWTSPGPPSFSFTGASPVVTPPVPTTYTVAASDGTCINTTTVFLATNPNPTITVSATSSMICNGQSVTVNANGGINYTWTATTGTFYTQSVTDSPTTAVAYNVVGDNSFNCTSGNTQIVLVNPNPTITIAATKTLVCSSGPSTLTASGANTFTWDANANGALTPGTIVHPINTTSGPVVYTVTGTYSATGCQSTKTVQVTVFVPTISIAGNTNTCYGGNVSFTASGGNNGSYSWNTGVGNPYTFPVLTTSITAPGVFTVSASTTSISVNCPGSQTVAVGIYYNPTITAIAERTTICKNESVELTGNGGVSYEWSNNMAGTTITVSPTGNVVNYTVTGTDANGCVSTGTVQVKISGCTGINELSNANSGLNIYPNPNNGEFIIQSDVNMNLTLSNELGQIVRTFILADSNNKVSVTDLAKGIYFLTGQKDNAQINQKIVVTR